MCTKILLCAVICDGGSSCQGPLHYTSFLSNTLSPEVRLVEVVDQRKSLAILLLG